MEYKVGQQVRFKTKKELEIYINKQYYTTHKDWDYPIDQLDIFDVYGKTLTIEAVNKHRDYVSKQEVTTFYFKGLRFNYREEFFVFRRVFKTYIE